MSSQNPLQPVETPIQPVSVEEHRPLEVPMQAFRALVEKAKQAPPASRVETMEVLKCFYESSIQMCVHTDSIIWNRLYNVLTALAMLVIGWVTLYGSNVQDKKIMMMALSGAALLLSLMWMPFGVRARKFQKYYVRQARCFEEMILRLATDQSTVKGPVDLVEHAIEQQRSKHEGLPWLQRTWNFLWWYVARPISPRATRDSKEPIDFEGPEFSATTTNYVVWGPATCALVSLVALALSALQ